MALNLASLKLSFAKFCDTKYCIGVSNGLDAIELILRVFLGNNIFSLGDDVIVPSHTFIATALAVNNCGLNPIFVEPNPNTFNIDPNLIEKSITKKTKAIIVVHLYGMPCDMDPIIRIAKQYNLKIIEDYCSSARS